MKQQKHAVKLKRYKITYINKQSKLTKINHSEDVLEGGGVMISSQSDKIIEKAKTFFKNEIVPNHIANTKRLTKLKEFNLNPFLYKYKASFLTGNDDPKSIAKALVYARALGPSINTTFG